VLHSLVERASRTTKSARIRLEAVSEEAASERIAVTWAPEARADLRSIDRETAIQILHCIDRYLF
jgi:hypothetical protein